MFGYVLDIVIVIVIAIIIVIKLAPDSNICRTFSVLRFAYLL